MPESVPSPSVAQSTMAATLFDEWVARGLTRRGDLPRLAVDAARRWPRRAAPGVTVHVRLDERSAGFFALGRALATVATRRRSSSRAARRPPNCTPRSPRRTSRACRWSSSPPTVPRSCTASARRRRSTSATSTGRWCGDSKSPASRATRPARRGARSPRACGTRRRAGATDPPGPVHLNLAFVEPLVAAPGELPAPRADGAPWTPRRGVVAGHRGPRGRGTPRPRRRRCGSRRRSRSRVRRAGLGRRGRRDGARVPAVRRPAAARRRVRRARCDPTSSCASAGLPASRVARRAAALVGCAGRRPARSRSGGGPRRRRGREPGRCAGRGRRAPAR